MGVLATMERRASPENPSTTLGNPAAWLVDFMTGGHRSSAGVTVSDTRAMSHATVMSCVKILAEALAMLPLHAYRRLDRGRERAIDHPIYELLHARPNPEITSFTFREVMQGYLGLRGNAYAEIEYAKSGRPIALWPLQPQRVTPYREDGLKRYRIELVNGSPVTLASEQVLHIQGFGYDGLVGLSPVGVMRHTLGLSVAAEEYGARFFGNGSKPGGVLTRPVGAPVLGKDARENLKRSWEEVQGGLANAHRVAILEEGMDWKQIGISPEDSQFLETRKFQRAEICGWFRVPPHMIADLDRSTNNNIEQQALEFLTFTMAPWLARWEQVLSWDLLGESDRGTIGVEFNVNALLRGDATARAAYYTSRFQVGSLSPNDIRELENENPVAGGDAYFVQGAYVELNRAAEAPAPSAPAATAPVQTDKSAARSLLPVIEDALRRATSREVTQARRAAKRGAGSVAEWAGDFYAEHRGYVARALAPAALALGASARLEIAVDALLADVRSACAAAIAAGDDAVTEHLATLERGESLSSLAERALTLLQES